MRRLLLVLLGLGTAGLVVNGVVPCDLLTAQPQCYAAFLPGPAEDALTKVAIGSDTPSFDSSGQLVLTTVRVDSTLSFTEWFDAMREDTRRLVDIELIRGPDQDDEDVARQNAQLMDESQVTATRAALAWLALPIEGPNGARVDDVGPLGDALSVGDVITAVNNVEVRTAQDAIGALGVASGPIPVRVERDGDVRVQDLAAEDLRLVRIITDFRFPVEVTLDAGQIGGPSAGLMFALAVIDRLGEDDLTGGRIIAGTGTIDVAGNVGPIGGIHQKVIGSLQREDGGPPAVVFLTPADQLREAASAPVSGELVLVPVRTLDDAVTALRLLARDTVPPGTVRLGGQPATALP